ncbi:MULTISPECIES: hypothetical protein [Bradyrhizobium]|uniref:hypothetical protein n=1 Tax=Bradyrhizobium TaxID=374 RepID=UPI001BACFD18|nr:MULTISPECIES: hypothetical protein [Bradyrhizobium]MBR0706789.1 hypothetical protein [Bradyrhizobium liaoningense]
MMDRLELAPLHRIGGTNPPHQERRTFDFVVNGVSLFEAAGGLTFDMCGSLSNPEFERDFARRFNGRTAAMLSSDAPVDGHRVALFVCPECGDFACGAITARVSRTDRGVRWSDFAHENEIDAASELGVGPFEFEWADYVNEIERSRAE